ncbi:hypothetical protein [Verrucosispora sp. SN26_14.1]|uniref:hypothetical protein n=1 Tax=Verrucosispora sp. SN26_14.1 TaxID=2527879 RepID=UPI0013758AA6|nr:hypothetical protein [Verrucosispora sp. SN26_14.1]
MKIERCYFGTALAVRAIGWRWRWTKKGPWHYRWRPIITEPQPAPTTDTTA